MAKRREREERRERREVGRDTLGLSDVEVGE